MCVCGCVGFSVCLWVCELGLPILQPKFCLDFIISDHFLKAVLAQTKALPVCLMVPLRGIQDMSARHKSTPPPPAFQS